MEKIIIRVSDLTGVSVADMRSKKRTSDVCEARKIFIHLSCKHLGVSQKDAALFINRTQQNISSQMLDFDQHLRIYKGLKIKLEIMEKQILT